MTARVRRLLASGVLLASLVWYLDPAAVFAHLAGAPLALLIPWVLAYEVLVVLLWALGLSAMIVRLGGIAYGRLVRIGFTLQALTLFIPGRLGDLSLVYLLRERFGVADSSALLVMDKLITLGLSALLAVLGLALLFSPWHGLAGLGALVAGIALTAGVFGSGARRLRAWIGQRLLRARGGEPIAGLARSLRTVAGDPLGVTGNLLCTLARTALAGLSLTLLLSWFGSDVVWWQVVLVQALAQMVALLPVTFMGIGLVEALNVALLGRIGVEPAVVLSAMLAARAVQLALMLGVAGYVMASTARGNEPV